MTVDYKLTFSYLHLRTNKTYIKFWKMCSILF